MPSPAPDLSVVVPTYNARVSAHKSANSLHDRLSGLGIAFEIILVDDGSLPANRPDSSVLPDSCRLVQLDANRGKGFAVRTGLQTARGNCRVFTDVDMPYGIDAVIECYRILAQGHEDFVVGDRTLGESVNAIPVSFMRRVSSAVFRGAVSTLASIPIGDTQCGLKGLSGSAADAIVPLLHVDRFAFDVEILRCAMLNGITPRPMPVRLVSGDLSTVRLIHDSLGMLRDLVAINRRAARGAYLIGGPRSDGVTLYPAAKDAI